MAEFVPVARVTDEFVPVEAVDDKSEFVPVERIAEEKTPSLRTVIPFPGEPGPKLGSALMSSVPQAFPSQEQARAESLKQGAAQQKEAEEAATVVRTQPPSPAQQQAILSGVAQPESEIEPIGKPGTILRGATSVAASVLNRPEYLAALANPATAAAVGIRFAPEIAKQFVEDLGAAAQGDNEALGRAAAIGIPALVGGVRAGKNITERLAAQTQLEKAASASNAAHIDALAREGMQPPPLAKPSLLPETQAELSKLPGGKDALSIRSSETLPLEKPPETGAEVGARVPESETPAVPQIEREQQPQPPAEEVSPVRDVAPEPFVTVKEVIPSEAKAKEGQKEGVLASDLPPESSAGKEVTTGAPTEAPPPSVEGRGAVPPEPEPIGMGGAVPSEFVPSSEGATAMKYRRIDAERIKRGLEPLAKPESRADQVAMDQAMAALDADPYLPEKLTAELTENPRPISDVENHVLLLRKIDLRNEYAKATRDIQQAAADGRMEDVRLAQERRAEWSAKLTNLEIASRLSGSERGRALRSLRVMANEDYSLAAMESEMSANRGGAPISEAERAELAAIETRYKEAQGKIKELEEVAKQREEVLKQSELARSLAEAKAAYDPRVLAVAEKFAGFMDKKAADAASRLKEKLRNIGAGVDPTIVADLTIMAAAKITRGAVDFARWSAEIAKDFGESVKPYLQEAWDAAKTQVAKDLEAWAKPLDKPTKEKLKQTVATEGAAKGSIDDITGKIRAKLEKDEGSEIHPLARKLFRAVIEENPVIGREEALTRVHDILRDVLPDITRQEASDAITGRGRFWQAAQDEISKTVRDLSTQLRLASHQLDVMAKKPLPRTGYQPDPFSDAARRERQKLNELKRKFGVVVTDPAKQLASALEARKTYYRNRMADLRSEIASRERIVGTKTPSPTDAELEALKSDYAKVKEEHDAIFGNRKLTDEQRLKMATAAAERNAAEWAQRLENARKGKFGPTKGPSRKVTSPELEAIRARTEAVKAEVAQLKALSDPKKSPAEIALAAYKTRTANQIAKLKEQIASGDFTKKAPTPVAMDKEATALQHELVLIKEARNEAMLDAKLRDEGPVRKLFRGGLEAVNAARAILTSIDLSAVLNQGKFIVLAHPIRGARSIGPMLRAFASPKAAFEVLREIQNRPNYPLYKASKLFLNEPGGTLAHMEEAYMSRWAKKIPVVAGSERAYTTFLNKLRADSFDAMASTLANGKPSLPEAKVISNFINVATGRGTIGMADQAAVGLNTFFFAPRFVASRFQMALGQPIYAGLPSGKLPFKGTAKARALVASEYAKLLMGYSIIYGLASAAGYKIGDDIRSSDFGKIILGSTRADVLAGVSQVSVLLGREISGQTKSLKGRVTPIRGPGVPYGGSTGASVAGNFLRTKLAPVPSIILDAATGKNVVGQPVTLSDIAARSLVPITVQDIYQIMRENEMPEAAALSTLALFGERMQTYTPQNSKPSTRRTTQKARLNP